MQIGVVTINTLHIKLMLFPSNYIEKQKSNLTIPEIILLFLNRGFKYKLTLYKYYKEHPNYLLITEGNKLMY